MLVTTLAPMTFPYFEKISFKSVARVRDERPDTHKFRLKALLLVFEELFVGDGAVIFVFEVETLTVIGAIVADADVAEASGISAIIRTENRKLIFN